MAETTDKEGMRIEEPAGTRTDKQTDRKTDRHTYCGTQTLAIKRTTCIEASG